MRSRRTLGSKEEVARTWTHPSKFRKERRRRLSRALRAGGGAEVLLTNESQHDRTGRCEGITLFRETPPWQAQPNAQNAKLCLSPLGATMQTIRRANQPTPPLFTTSCSPTAFVWTPHQSNRDRNRSFALEPTWSCLGPIVTYYSSCGLLNAEEGGVSQIPIGALQTFLACPASST